MNHRIEEHRTWTVIDSTKLKEFMRCPRRYWWNYVVGWRPEGESIHLIFGAAWHLAMEHLTAKYQEKGHNYDPADIPRALELLTEYYRQYYTEDQDVVNEPKNPGYSLEAMALYIQRFSDDKFEVLATEIAGTVPIAEGRRIHFKIDALCQDPLGKLFVLEHKHSGRMTLEWADQWILSCQVGTYIHALMCLQDPDLVYGARVRGTFFRKKGIDFINALVKKSAADMQAWLTNTNHYIDMIEEEHERLAEADEGDQVMEAFPMNTESCFYFGQKCPYHDFCIATCNPLSIAGSGIQPRFEKVYWDPMEEYKKTAKQIVNVGEEGVEDG